MRPGQQEGEQLGPAFAIDDPVDEVRAKAALEGDHGFLGIRDVVAEPFKGKQESGVGPIGIHQVPRRAGQRQASLGQGPPRKELAGIFLASRRYIAVPNNIAAADTMPFLDVGNQRNNRRDLLVRKNAIAELMLLGRPSTSASATSGTLRPRIVATPAPPIRSSVTLLPLARTISSIAERGIAKCWLPMETVSAGMIVSVSGTRRVILVPLPGIESTSTTPPMRSTLERTTSMIDDRRRLGEQAVCQDEDTEERNQCQEAVEGDPGRNQADIVDPAFIPDSNRDLLPGIRRHLPGRDGMASSVSLLEIHAPQIPGAVFAFRPSCHRD